MEDVDEREAGEKLEESVCAGGSLVCSHSHTPPRCVRQAGASVTDGRLVVLPPSDATVVPSRVRSWKQKSFFIHEGVHCVLEPALGSLEAKIGPASTRFKRQDRGR